MDKIEIIADVLNIHPDPLREGISIHEVTTEEMSKFMDKYAAICQSEREKELQSRITELEATNKELNRMFTELNTEYINYKYKKNTNNLH